ncbi:MAG TPA: MBL fold metallo-hydrolase, partial [Gemmatimonadales bacterium]|nr:MBL fold metallo-hydrolase [Gemmatimonadales bacterium]
MRRFAVALTAIAVTAATAAAQSPRDVVARGLDAIGGESAVRALGALTTDFYSANFALGQSELPASPPRASVVTGRIVTDWRAGRRHVAQEIRAVTGAVIRQRIAIAANAGAVGEPGQQTPLAAGALAAQQQAMRRMPHRLLLAALDDPGSLSPAPAREFRGMMHDAVRMAGADTATLYFDRASGMLTVSETVTDDPILGTRITQTWYTRWQPVGGGMLYPRQIDTFVNGQIAVHLINTTASAEPAAESLFALPDSIAARATPPAAGALEIEVRMVELAPGVWRAEGGSHHTLVVEQADQLVLVEAPQTTQRVRAVLDTVRARWPGKRIGVVAMTHHHWDHSGGIREVIAEGIPLATHEANAAFVRQVASARRT